MDLRNLVLNVEILLTGDGKILYLILNGENFTIFIFKNLIKTSVAEAKSPGATRSRPFLAGAGAAPAGWL